MYSLPVAAAAILASTSLVAGHGQINRVQHGGASNTGPNIYYSGDSANSKTATRMMYKASSPSYVLFDSFTDNSKMSCEGSSKSPAPNTISVAAGEEIDIYWEGATSELKGKAGTGSLTAYNPWVHAMGFVFDYITSCNGDCSTFDATNAGWTKIAHGGIDTSKSISSELRATMKGKPEEYFPTSGPGLWAMAKLGIFENGSKWSIKIPSSLKSGQYMIRHELAAVHNPKTGDPTTGPQLYITCIQLDVTNGGDMSLPTGTQAKSLYRPDGAFANINVYSDSFNPASVEIPGPAVWDGVSSSVDDRSKRMPRSSSTPSSSTNSKPCRHNTTKSKRTPKRSHNEPLRRAQQNHLS